MNNNEYYNRKLIEEKRKIHNDLVRIRRRDIKKIKNIFNDKSDLKDELIKILIFSLTAVILIFIMSL